MRDELLKAGRWAIEQARNRGVEAEAFLLHSEDLTIEVRDGQVDTLKQAEEIGIGVRVFRDNRMGFSFTTALDQAAVREAIERALAGARYTADDENNGLPGSQQLPEMATYDEYIEKTELETKVEMARQVEAEARRHDKRLKWWKVQVMRNPGTGGGSKLPGTEAFQRGAFCGLYISLMAEENEQVQTDLQ